MELGQWREKSVKKKLFFETKNWLSENSIKLLFPTVTKTQCLVSTDPEKQSVVLQGDFRGLYTDTIPVLLGGD